MELNRNRIFYLQYISVKFFQVLPIFFTLDQNLQFPNMSIVVKRLKSVSFILLFALSLSSCTQMKIDKLNKKGMELFEQKKFKAANQVFSEILSLDKDFLPAYFNRAISNSFLSQNAKALKDLNHIIKIQGYSEEALLNRAIIFENLGKYSEAIKDYDQILEVNPHHLQALHYKGISLYYIGDFNAAIKEYDTAIKNGLDVSGVYYNKGVSLDCLNKYKEAINCYSKAIKIDKKFKQAIYARGVAYFNIKDSRLAKANLEYAKKLGHPKAASMLKKMK